MDAPEAIVGSKKRANEAQESSKTNLDALFGRSIVPEELPRDPQELPKVARESPKTLSKPSLGRKRWFFKNVRISQVKSTFSKVGDSVRELKVGPKTFREEIKKHNDAPQAIVGSKKRANEAQESSKANLEALSGRSRGPKELPRYPQEHPKGAQGSPKTLSKPSLDRK